jgi:TPR repeat protein
MAAAGIMMVAFMLFQAWHHVHIVAATSRMDHPSEQNAVRKVEQFRPVPPVQASHMQVSDRVVLPVVEALSPYEIRGLRRQADYGDDSAAFVMGMVYETGRYVPQSCTKAAEWVTRSANGGNAAAQYNLGLRYRDGDGVPANEDEAEKWLRKAADQKYSNTRPALKTSPTDQKPIQ